MSVDDKEGTDFGATAFATAADLLGGRLDGPIRSGSSLSTRVSYLL